MDRRRGWDQSVVDWMRVVLPKVPVHYAICETAVV